MVRLRRGTLGKAEAVDRLRAMPNGGDAVAILAAQCRIGVRTWSSGLSGARLRGLRQPLDCDSTVTLVADTGTTTPRRYDGIDVQVARVPTTHRDLAATIPCVSLARNIIDIARHHCLSTALIVGDHALSRGLARDELMETLTACTGMHGILPPGSPWR